jgi:hypothetical protein
MVGTCQIRLESSLDRVQRIEGEVYREAGECACLLPRRQNHVSGKRG